MPEMYFRVQWPDGNQEDYYSPSLVIKDYFSVSTDYELKDFLTRSRTSVARQRVEGVPASAASICSPLRRPTVSDASADSVLGQPSNKP